MRSVLVGSNEKLDRLFLHFFDVHFIEEKGRAADTAGFLHELRLAARLAVASSDRVLIPASSFAESPHCWRIIRELEELFPLGFIALSASASNFDTYIAERLDVSFYRSNSPQHAAYRGLRLSDNNPPYLQRSRSATADIIKHWNGLLRTDRLPRLLRSDPGPCPRDLERRLERVPSELGALAFVPSHVYEVLGIGEGTAPIHSRIRSVVNEGYFASYTRDLGAGVLLDLNYLSSPYSVPSFGRNLSYRLMIQHLHRYDRLKELETCPPSLLVRLAQDPIWREGLARAISAAGKVVKRAEVKRPKIFNGWRAKMKQLRGFIVHGHDRGALFEFKDFIQNRLGLPEPVVLEQQPNAGMTIIEKFEAHANDVDVAFVLMTPDDKLNTAELTYRARQNVLFELGFFMGKFGRKSGRVMLLHKGPLDIPSDLAGLIYIDITAGVSAAGETIRRELDAIS